MLFNFQFELDFIFSYTTCKNASLNTKVIFDGVCDVELRALVWWLPMHISNSHPKVNRYNSSHTSEIMIFDK